MFSLVGLWFFLLSIKTKQSLSANPCLSCDIQALVVATRVVESASFHKKLSYLQVAKYISYIVVTTRKLSLLSGIIDSNQHSSFGSLGRWGTNLKILIHINETRRGQLRDLIKSHVQQYLSHGSQQTDPGYRL